METIINLGFVGLSGISFISLIFGMAIFLTEDERDVSVAIIYFKVGLVSAALLAVYLLFFYNHFFIKGA